MSKKKPKIGQGHAMAMLRLGFKELQATVMTESNVARGPEPGSFANPTQGEVAAERKPKERSSILDKYSSSPEAEARRARAANKGRGKDRGGPERE